MKKSLPPINTSALPDIIFILLFFFMTITVISDYDNNLEVNIPEVASKVKLEYKKGYGHIYLGSDEQRLQLNDKFIHVSEISGAISSLSDSNPNYRSKLYFDRALKMTDVNKVKLEIRKSHALKVEYVLK